MFKREIDSLKSPAPNLACSHILSKTITEPAKNSGYRTLIQLLNEKTWPSLICYNPRTTGIYESIRSNTFINLWWSEYQKVFLLYYLEIQRQMCRYMCRKQTLCRINMEYCPCLECGKAWGPQLKCSEVSGWSFNHFIFNWFYHWGFTLGQSSDWFGQSTQFFSVLMDFRNTYSYKQSSIV